MPPHRIVENLVDSVHRVKTEIFCREELVEEVVADIDRTGRTGLRGDGRICGSSLEAAVRTSTGDCGDEAV